MQIQIEGVKGSQGGVGDKKYARYRGRGGGQRWSREPFRPFDQSLFGGKWAVNGTWRGSAGPSSHFKDCPRVVSR